MNEALIELNAVLVDKGLDIAFSTSDNNGFITVHMIKKGQKTVVKSNAKPGDISTMCSIAIKALS